MVLYVKYLNIIYLKYVLVVGIILDKKKIIMEYKYNSRLRRARLWTYMADIGPNSDLGRPLEQLKMS